MSLVRVLVALVAVGGAVAAQDKPAGDASPLAGKWKVTAGAKNGERMDESKLNEVAVFTKDKVTMKTPDGAFEFTYTADAKATPMTVDMTVVKPDMFKGAKALGIVKVTGTAMTLCYNAEKDGKRPTIFQSSKDNKCFLFVLEKQPEVKKDEPKK